MTQHILYKSTRYQQNSIFFYEIQEVIIRDKLCDSTWPVYDEVKTVDVIFELVVQVNGKERGKIEVDSSISKEEMEKLYRW